MEFSDILIQVVISIIEDFEVLAVSFAALKPIGLAGGNYDYQKCLKMLINSVS